jgi:ribosomal protein S18 acetylase RimI-like enzyme
MTVEVTEATSVDDVLVDALARLIPQLSKSNPPPTADELREIVANPNTFVFVARDGEQIVGSLTLATFRIPTGLRAWIEDVVVDESARGMKPGVGRLLNEAALAKAREIGCRTVDLTSRPSREAANALYVRLGFELRDSNLYRYDLGN